MRWFFVFHSYKNPGVTHLLYPIMHIVVFKSCVFSAPFQRYQPLVEGMLIFCRVYKYMCSLQIQHLSQDWPAFFFRCFSPLWAIYMSGVSSVQSLSRVQLCNPMDCSMPGFPVRNPLQKLAKTRVHWLGDAIQPSHPLSSPSHTALNCQSPAPAARDSTWRDGRCRWWWFSLWLILWDYIIVCWM